jgi:hypothetical protein
MKCTCAHLHIQRLHDSAALISPKGLQGTYHSLQGFDIKRIFFHNSRRKSGTRDYSIPAQLVIAQNTCLENGAVAQSAIAVLC